MDGSKFIVVYLGKGRLLAAFVDNNVRRNETRNLFCTAVQLDACEQAAQQGDIGGAAEWLQARSVSKGLLLL